MSIEEYNEDEEYEQTEGNTSSEFDDDDYSDEEPEKKKSKKGARILLFIAVLLLVGLNVYLGMQLGNKKTSLEEKEAELKIARKDKRAVDSMVTIYKSRIDSFSKVDGINKDSLSALSQKLDEIVAELNTTKKIAASRLQWKNAAIQLSALQRDFDAQKKVLDSVVAQNKLLEKERDQYQSLSKQQEDSLAELAKNNKKLEMLRDLGAEHKVTPGLIESFKVKGSGSEKATNKASQVNLIRVNYSIAANAISKKGATDVYIVCTLGGKVLAPKGSISLAGGKSTEWTFKEQINFQGKEIESFVTLDDKTMSFDPGAYTFKFYMDGKLKGEKTYQLR